MIPSINYERLSILLALTKMQRKIAAGDCVTTKVVLKRRFDDRRKGSFDPVRTQCQQGTDL